MVQIFLPQNVLKGFCPGLHWGSSERSSDRLALLGGHFLAKKEREAKKGEKSGNGRYTRGRNVLALKRFSFASFGCEN